jgi:hypothetical protein
MDLIGWPIEYATTQGSHSLAYKGSHQIGFSNPDEKASNALTQ